MIKKFNHLLLLILSASLLTFSLSAQEATGNTVPKKQQYEEIDVQQLILDHLADTYEWHLFTINNKAITIPLPVIVYSKHHGLKIYSSSVITPDHTLDEIPFYISPEGEYKGKIVYRVGEDEVRPLDLSLTKNAASVLLSSFILIAVVMGISRNYKDESFRGKKGFSGALEFLIESLMNDVIRPSIGRKYKSYAKVRLYVFP